LAEITQQIHSLRASGERLFQAVLVTDVESMALRKSGGALCTVPGKLVLFTVILELSAVDG
jgi:hypothetical protein